MSDQKGFWRFTVLFRQPVLRAYFSGQLLSLTGTWMQRVAESWLAWELTHSAWMLGLVSFCGLFPGIFTNFLAGALLDRFNRRLIILTTQWLLSIQALNLAFLTWQDLITVPLLIMLTITQAVISGVDMPARQSFLVYLTNREYLPQTIAMNSVTVNIGRIAGPALSAVVIPWWGLEGAFLLNGLSFIFLIVVIHRLNLLSEQQEKEPTSFFKSIREGLVYVFRHPVMGPYLVLFGACNFLAMYYASLLPVFSDEKFGAGSHGLSIMLVSAGAGALAGAVFIGGWVSSDRVATVLRWSSLVLALSVIGMAAAPLLHLAVIALFAGGFSMMLQISGTNMLLQNQTTDEYRGRVMSLYTFTFTLGTPLGNLWAGALAEAAFPELPFYTGGVLLIIVFFHLKSALKRRTHHA
ncbi:MAG: MFS transporter [Bacteroidetes bacterium]|nr:MFS transporter [Bacteroidota bacterium]